MAFKAELPPDVKLPDGHSINTSDARYQALHSLAERERWSQKAFSDILGIEAKRVSAEHERARAAAPAPAPAPAAKVDLSKMNFREKMQHALQQNAAKRGY
jgi:hypothetical protein